jgi:hypothetical protein
MKSMFWLMHGRWWGVKGLRKIRFSYRNGWQDAFFIVRTHQVIYSYLKRIGWKNVQSISMVNLPTMCKALVWDNWWKGKWNNFYSSSSPSVFFSGLKVCRSDDIWNNSCHVFHFKLWKPFGDFGISFLNVIIKCERKVT